MNRIPCDVLLRPLGRGCTSRKRSVDIRGLLPFRQVSTLREFAARMERKYREYCRSPSQARAYQLDTWLHCQPISTHRDPHFLHTTHCPLENSPAPNNAPLARGSAYKSGVWVKGFLELSGADQAKRKKREIA